jgi:hypothetical protein
MKNIQTELSGKFSGFSIKLNPEESPLKLQSMLQLSPNIFNSQTSDELSLLRLKAFKSLKNVFSSRQTFVHSFSIFIHLLFSSPSRSNSLTIQSRDLPNLKSNRNTTKSTPAHPEENKFPLFIYPRRFSLSFAILIFIAFFSRTLSSDSTFNLF